MLQDVKSEAEALRFGLAGQSDPMDKVLQLVWEDVRSGVARKRWLFFVDALQLRRDPVTFGGTSRDWPFWSL